MKEPNLVADGVKAMLDVVSIPVTVKHRIGIDRDESYAFLRDFVGAVADAGCTTFIVHARNAWLQGLSPKENRDIPPLRYELVHRLKQDFKHLRIEINGGITTSLQVTDQLQHLDGVMVGREAYHNPWWLAEWDHAFFGEASGGEGNNITGDITRDTVEAQMVDYMEREAAHGTHWYSMARHMLGLRHGQPGARRWRQVWSDHRLKHLSAAEVSALALHAMQEASLRPAAHS
jgi:tRNA-dihydrouridine synthase A